MIKLRDLITSIILGTSLIVSNARGDINQKIDTKKESTKEQVYDQLKETKHLKSFPKLILKPAQSSKNVFLATHSSHSSHSSHASHSSHYSSSTGGGTAEKKKTDTEKVKEPEVISTPGTEEIGTRDLVKGMKGSDVFEMEKLLVLKGYKFTPDDVFDNKTEKIVKDFQSKNDITPDGKVDYVTLYYLKQSTAEDTIISEEKENINGLDSTKLGSRLLVKGMKGLDVLEMEKLLVSKGYKLTPDEVFDEYTEIALKDFQSKNGIPVDGKVGFLTVYYLKQK
jgi:peptidoglycan hydrolase-like protein with peptidoglycan-binding domain